MGGSKAVRHDGASVVTGRAVPQPESARSAADVPDASDVYAPLTVHGTSTAPQDWDAALRSFGSSPFHGLAWARYLRSIRAEPCHLTLRRNGRPVGVAVARVRRSRYRFLGPLRSRLELNAPPLLADEVPLADALTALARWGKMHALGSLTVSSYADQRPSETVSQRGLRVRHASRLEYRIPLGPDFDATLARMATGHRRNIRKSLREPFEAWRDDSLSGAMVLRALQDETFARRRRLGHDHAGPWESNDFQKVCRAFLADGAMEFFFVGRGGRALSAVGILKYGVRAYYLVGGTSTEGYRCGAAFRVFAEVMKNLIDRGFIELNLGGTGVEARQQAHPDHGLFRFKTGFGSQVLLCHNLRVRLWP